MSNIIDVGVGTVRKNMVPWFIIAAVIALFSAGGSGLYFGYELATGRYATEKLEMATAYNAALAEKEARRVEAEKRSQMVEGNFLSALRSLQSTNKFNYGQILEETKKAIYDACKVPDSGVDLLNDHIDAVNSRILGSGKK